MSKKWVLLNRQSKCIEGMFDTDELFKLIHLGKVSFQDAVWCEGMEEWKTLSDCPDFQMKNESLSYKMYQSETVHQVDERRESRDQMSKEELLRSIQFLGDTQKMDISKSSEYGEDLISRARNIQQFSSKTVSK